MDWLESALVFSLPSRTMFFSGDATSRRMRSLVFVSADLLKTSLVLLIKHHLMGR